MYSLGNELCTGCISLVCFRDWLSFSIYSTMSNAVLFSIHHLFSLVVIYHLPFRFLQFVRFQCVSLQHLLLLLLRSLFSILVVTITTMMMSFTACFADFLLTRHALYWQVGLMPVTCAIGNIPSRHWSLHPLKLIVCFFCQRSIFILASRALPVVRVKRYFKEKEMIFKFLLL